MTLTAYSGGYYGFPEGSLYFKHSLFGMSRVHALPRDAIRSSTLFHDESVFIYLGDQLEKIQGAIAVIGKAFGWAVPKDPLIACVKFSERIRSQKLHLNKQLSLKELGLTLIPPQIALFENVTHLDLSGNKLRKVFPELPYFHQLEELDISGNEGLELPDLSHLENLRVIKANRCGWREVPSWIQAAIKKGLKVELQGNLLTTMERQESKKIDP